MDRIERRLRTGLAANRRLWPALELALPPRLFYTVVASFANDRRAGAGEHDLFNRAAPALRDAIHGALGAGFNRPAGAGLSALDLLGLLNAQLLLPFEARGRATVISVVTHFVNRLHDDGIVLLPEDGPIRDALLAVVELLDDYPDLAAGVDRSARKNAGHLLTACRGFGLYAPLPVVGVAA